MATMVPEKIHRLELTKKALDDPPAEFERGQYPAALLEDLKDSVDHARTTLWIMMKLEEERRAAVLQTGIHATGKAARLKR